MQLLHTFLPLAGHPNVGAYASRPSCACVRACMSRRLSACMHAAFLSSCWCIRICAAGTTTHHFAFGTCDAMHARTTTTFASLFWPAGQIGSEGQPEPDRRMHASYMVTEAPLLCMCCTRRTARAYGAIADSNARGAWMEWSMGTYARV